MNRCTYVCVFVLCGASFAFAQPPAASPSPAAPVRPVISESGTSPLSTRDLVNRLNQSGLQQVIEQLRLNYVDANALTNQEINEATVEGLISKLGPGVSIETKT